MNSPLVTWKEHPHAFDKRDRLLWRSMFMGVQRHGRKVHTKYFVLFLLANDLGRVRLGITVSRKVGSAVVRNRVKRRVREVFRQHREFFPPSSDLVIIARKSAARVSYDEILRDLHTAGRRLGRSDGRAARR